MIQPTTITLDQLLSRKDIELKESQGVTYIDWRPTGPNIPDNSSVTFSFLPPVPDKAGVMRLLGSLKDLPTEGGVEPGFLTSPGVQKLLEHTAICTLKNYDASNETLLFKGAPTLTLENVTFDNCNVALTGKTVNTTSSSFRNSRILVDSELGTMTTVTIDSDCTTSG